MTGKKLKGTKIKLSYSNVGQTIILHTFEQDEQSLSNLAQDIIIHTFEHGTISISPPHIQTRQDSSTFSPPHISIPKKIFSFSM